MRERSKISTIVKAMAALVMIAVASPSLGASDQAVYFPVKGGAGDIANGVECPTGHYIVGFRGRWGLWIDQLSIRCAPLRDGGGVGQSKTIGGGGGGGGHEDAERCGTGFIVNDLRFYNTAGNRQVELLRFRCMDPDDRAEEGVTYDFGNPDGPRSVRFRQTCEEGQAAIGLRMRWGAHVNAIGLVCDILRRP